MLEQTMTSTTLRRAVAALTLSAAAAAAPAAVIDFEALAHDGADPVLVGTYEEDGFRLTSNIDPVFADQAFGAWGAGSPDFNGSTALFNAYPGFVTTLQAIGSAAFTPVSIDVGPITADIAGSITFIGTRSAGLEVTQSFAFGPALAPPARLAFDASFRGIVSLSWEQEGVQAHQFDNIDVRPAAVPEPRTTALLIVGLLFAVIWTARRRRHNAVRVRRVKP